MKVFTRTGDDGTTGLLFGGRIAKDHPIAVAVGDTDESQAAIGVARALADERSDSDYPEGRQLASVLLACERDLWVVMAELATAAGQRHKLVAGKTRVTPAMVERLEGEIAVLATRFEPLSEFVVPGQNSLAAALDMGRAVVRRAERSAVTALRPEAGGDPDGNDIIGQVDGTDASPGDSHVVPYLNRLSALLWAAARAHEGQPLTAREREKPTDGA